MQRAELSVVADPAAARALLDEMGDDVQRALDETAALALRIYPAQIDGRGLAAALRSAVMSAGISGAVEVRSAATHLPEVTATVYLCCLEALEELGAGARASVTVLDGEGAIGFEVVEDGADAAASEPRSGAGLERLRDRVEALGGRLTVHEEGGLHVVGTIPLPR